MSLDAFVSIVVRRGWLAVVCGVLLGGAAYLVASRRTPIYEAESRVAITAAKPADLGQTEAINGLLRSFAADVVTTDMAQEVSGSVGGIDVETLKANASAGADEGTREVRIHYHSPDAAEAEHIADVWASVFVARRTKANLQLDQGDRVFATKRDATTHHLWWPRKKLLTGLALAAGFALGALLALLWEYDAAAYVRGERDVEGLAVGPWLGSVPVDAPGAPRRRGRDVRGAAKRAARLLWPVAAGAVAGLVLAVALSAGRPTEYRARTRVAIEPARTSDWGQTQAIREILRGYSEDIATTRMADEVSRRLQLDLPAAGMLEILNVAPNEETYEVWIDVIHPDAALAEDISRTWAQVFIENRSIANQELDARDRILASVRDARPAELYAPKPMENGLAGLFMGALVGAVVAVVLARGRGVETVPEEVAADEPIVGLIPSPE